MSTFSHFADTSFLCATLRKQDNTPQATDCMAKISEPIAISSLVLFEFRYSLQFQPFLFARDRTQGFPASEALNMTELLRKDMDAEAIIVATADWADVHYRAERLAVQFTREMGGRAMDILHVATALHLGSRHFLTLDALQAKLARAAGLKSPLP